MTLNEIIDLAKKHARITYPSVLIAQALHESGLLTAKGASGLALKYHNWFGIKGSYKGKTTPKLDTAEYINGQWIEIKDGFRWYENDDQSFEDREDLLDSNWGRSVYSRFHQAQTVEGQTLGLQGVYATDPTYSDKLLAYIKQYNLKQYDVGFVIGKGIEKENEEMGVTISQLVAEIKKHAGATKYSTAHKALVDYYNTQKSLPRGTRMTYDWDWCAMFVSVVLMRLGLAPKYGTEISVGFYKQKFIDAKIWKGKVRPQVGDIIIWNWDESNSPGGWPDHIGFVTAVNGNSITTTEGNTFKNGVSLVGSNTYAWNASSIQGYARMDLGTAVNTNMTFEQVVLAVLAGSMGNGAKRIANIKAAGQDPYKVQEEVNKRLTTATAPAPTKSVAEVAQEVIAGKWSSGSDRAEKLKNAGYDAVAVQTKVNELLKTQVDFSGHKNKIVLSEDLIILDAIAGKRRGLASKDTLIKFDEVYINDGLYIAYLNGDGERCYIKIAEMDGAKVDAVKGEVSKS